MNITAWIVDVALLGAEWVMWLLMLLSVLSIAIMIERALFYRAQRVDMGELQTQAQSALEDPSKTEGFLKRFSLDSSMPIAVAKAGLAQQNAGLKSTEEAMLAAKTKSRQSYDKRLIILGTLGNNAPFIGLFGTVLGIISAFQRLQNNPSGGVEVVMGEVSSALAATAVGIAVAIPAVVAFNLLGRKVRSALADSDAIAHSILATMHATSGRSNTSGTE